MIWENHIELVKGTVHQVKAQMDHISRQGWEPYGLSGSLVFFKRRDLRAEKMAEVLAGETVREPVSMPPPAKLEGRRARA